MNQKTEGDERLKALLEARDHDGILEVLATLESRRPLTPAELILKGRCIQLGSGAGSGSEGGRKSFY